jgi:hypothetical protein
LLVSLGELSTDLMNAQSRIDARLSANREEARDA